MISQVTFLEMMIRDIMKDPEAEVDYDKYFNLSKKYKPTLDGMVEEFEDSIFGVHYTRRNRETFIELLAHHGWRYF